MATTELRDLTLAELDAYALSAMTTWGDTKHFKHFLPRLFEIAATNFDDYLCAEVLFGKLRYGNWDEWPAQERRAVSQFLHALWLSMITAEIKCAGDDAVDRALCAIGNACHTVTPFLRQWIDSRSNSSIRQLAQFVLLNVHDITEHQRLSGSFWNDRLAQAQEVLDWLRHPATYEFLYDHQQILDSRLSDAISALAWL